VATLDANVSTIANPATWRTKLGLGDVLAGILDLNARCAAIEARLDAIEAAPTILADDGLIYRLKLATVDGTLVLDWEVVA
jgi:hypothetical protein